MDSTTRFGLKTIRPEFNLRTDPAEHADVLMTLDELNEEFAHAFAVGGWGNARFYLPDERYIGLAIDPDFAELRPFTINDAGHGDCWILLCKERETFTKLEVVDRLQEMFG